MVPVELLSLAELEQIGLPHSLSVERGKVVLKMYADALFPRRDNQVQIHNLVPGDFADVEVSLINGFLMGTLGWDVRADVRDDIIDGSNIAWLHVQRDLRGMWARLKKVPAEGKHLESLLLATAYERVLPPTNVLGHRVEYLINVVSSRKDIKDFIAKHDDSKVLWRDRSIKDTFSIVPSVAYFVFNGILYQNATTPKGIRVATLTESDLAEFFPNIPSSVYDALSNARKGGVSVPLPLAVDSEPMTRAIVARGERVTGGEVVSKELTLVGETKEEQLLRQENEDLVTRIQGVARRFVDGMFAPERIPNGRCRQDYAHYASGTRFDSLLDLGKNDSRIVEIHRLNDSTKYVKMRECWRAQFKTSGETVFFLKDVRNYYGRTFGQSEKSKLMFALDFYQRVGQDEYVINTRCTTQEDARMLMYNDGEMFARGVLKVPEIKQVVMHGRLWDYWQGRFPGELSRQQRQVTPEDAQNLIPEDKHLYSNMTIILPDKFLNKLTLSMS